jgi:hypothetical protein
MQAESSARTNKSGHATRMARVEHIRSNSDKEFDSPLHALVSNELLIGVVTKL